MVLERALYKCICNLPSHNGFSKHTYCHWTPFYKNLTELSLSRCIVDASNETKSAHALAALKHFNVTCIQLLFMKSCVAPIPYTTIALFWNKQQNDFWSQTKHLPLTLNVVKQAWLCVRCWSKAEKGLSCIWAPKNTNNPAVTLALFSSPTSERCQNTPTGLCWNFTITSAILASTLSIFRCSYPLHTNKQATINETTSQPWIILLCKCVPQSLQSWK